MRVGTRVCNRFGPSRTGTVFKTEGDCHRDSEDPCMVTVRWDDGGLDVVNTDEEQLVDVTPRLFINVYLLTREYGGPEEGGWTYSQYTPEEGMCMVTETPEQAAKIFDEMNAHVAELNQDRRPLNSVLSDGKFVVMREAFPAEEQPTHKPCYQ